MKEINGNEELNGILANLRGPSQEFWLLQSSGIINFLQRFLKKEVSATDLEAWAETLEMNETVVYEQTHKQIIADVLFALSNPAINSPLTPDTVTALIQRFKN